MEKIILLKPPNWTDYELIDVGDGEKLERFGKYTVIRPEPKALWSKQNKQLWNTAIGWYERNTAGGGTWNFKQPIDVSWNITWRELTFLIKPTGFKHMGIFPEQAALWEIIQKKIRNTEKSVNVLNLFGYTGGSTLAAASAGASVTHIDASKEILTWARENAQLSHLENNSIRWIPEDAVTFVKREIKRRNRYDAIIMDPPKFGRGSKGEVWKLEEDLPHLIHLCSELLSEAPLFIIINAYAISLSSITLENLLQQFIEKYRGRISSGEIITISSTNIKLPQSIFSLWERK